MISNNVLGGFLLIYNGRMHRHTLTFDLSLICMLLDDLLWLALKLLVMM